MFFYIIYGISIECKKHYLQFIEYLSGKNYFFFQTPESKNRPKGIQIFNEKTENRQLFLCWFNVVDLNLIRGEWILCFV